MFMDSLSRIADYETRSISPENMTGGKGMGAMTESEDGSAKLFTRELGKGWKCNHCLPAEPGETYTIAEVEGEGAITHMWFTGKKSWRNLILRIYWDGSEIPSVECPISDFFLCGWDRFQQVSSLAICTNPSGGFNSYFRMPYRKGFKITLENRNDELNKVFYQITYSTEPVGADEGYFHAYFSRVNPLPYKQVYTILDKIEGKGQYVGTALSWGANNGCWWGEGEVKFYMDGDGEYPTICGTGTEDYFGGAWCCKNPETGLLMPYTTPYAGIHAAFLELGKPPRYGMYRWHITDPIRFQKDLSVTVQALGWRSGLRFLPLQDDIASVAYFYLDHVCEQKPVLGDRNDLEVI